MSNALTFLASVWWALLIAAILGFLICWLFFRGKKVDGDLSVEGEGALRAEADSLRARVQELEGRVSTRDTEISGLKGKLAAGAAGAAAAGAAVSAIAATGAKDDASEDDTYALEWRNRYLAARVKYLESQVAEAPKPKAKKAPAKKKAVAKTAAKPKTKAKPKAAARPKAKAAAKPKTKTAAAAKKKAPAKAASTKAKSTTTGRKKPGPKPGTKRGALTAAGKPRQKPGPKKGSTRKSAKPSAADAAFEKYYTNVKKYDPKARKPVVQGIVKYCGIALKTRDGSLVACSDESELKTVADGFVTKKLEKKSGQMDLVKEVCQDMKGERFKNRVTFYYLAAKKARKLGKFT